MASWVMLLPDDSWAGVYWNWEPEEDVLDPVLEVIRALPASSQLFCPFPKISPHAAFKGGKSTIRLSLDFCRLVGWKSQVLIMTEHSMRLHSIAWWLPAATFDNSDFSWSEFPSKKCIMPCDTFNNPHCSTAGFWCCASLIPAYTSLSLSLFVSVSLFQKLMWHLVQWHSDICAGISFQLHLRRNAKSSFEILRLLLHFPQGSNLRSRLAALTQKGPRCFVRLANVLLFYSKSITRTSPNQRRGSSVRPEEGLDQESRSQVHVQPSCNLLCCVHALAANVDWQAWKRLWCLDTEAHWVLGINLFATWGGGGGEWGDGIGYVCHQQSVLAHIAPASFFFVSIQTKRRETRRTQRVETVSNMTNSVCQQWGSVSTWAQLRLNNVNTLTCGGWA